MSYKWMLLGFDKATERLGFEREIPTMSVAAMRAIFGLPDDDPVVGASMPVEGADQTARLAPHVQGIDWNAFDYFIEAVAD